MKRIVCVLTISLCILFLVACNINADVSHTHDYSVVNHNENAHWLECECNEKAAVEFHRGGSATCTDFAVCSVCSTEYGKLEDHDYTVTNKNEAHHWLECSCGDKKTIENHSYTILKFNETEHWYECMCGDKANNEPHKGGAATEIEKAKCSVCSFEYGDVKKATEGLKFVLNEKQTEYAVAEYWGTSEDIYIPSTYLGKPVTAILEGAFSFAEAVFITSITIPDSIVTIEGRAFDSTVKAVFYCEAKSKPDSWNQDWNYSRSWTCRMPVVWDCKNNNFADDGYIYGIKIGAINYAITDNEAKVVGTNIAGDVTVPESIVYNGASYTVTSIGCAAFAFNNSSSLDGWSTGFDLKSISLPGTIRSIEMGAFCGCCSLTSMVIPDGVTTIAWGAFARCRSLEEIEIPDSVLYIGEYAFQESALKSVTIPGSVLNIAECVFTYCDWLTSIIVEENNPNYTSIDGNLYSEDGKKLLVYAPGKSSTNFTIPSDVTSIAAYAFYYCKSLTTVVIPSSVTNIESHAFFSSERLTIYCEAPLRPINWSANWIYGNTIAYWDGDWEYDANGDPTTKKSEYLGEYVLHHIDKQPISGTQATTYNLGDYYFGTVLNQYTISAHITNGTGNDYIRYNFGYEVYVNCNFVILDNSTAIAYLDSEVDLFNSGNPTDIFYFDIVEIDGQICFVLKATYGQSNYAYYVVKSSI